jgi:LysR substrate binding domain
MREPVSLARSSGEMPAKLSRWSYTGVECERFLRVDAVCALPWRHALARKRTIAVSDLVGGPGVFQQAIEETFARAGIEPRFAIMAQYTAARCGLVAEGLGLAIVDPLPARELSGLPIVLRPFQPCLPIETMLIRPGGRPPGNLAARFINLLKVERDAVMAPAETGRMT